MKTLLLMALALWTAGCSSGPTRPSGPARSALSCMTEPTVPTTLPEKLPIGAETIHRDPQRLISIFLPMGSQPGKSRKANWRILDSNEKNPTGTAAAYPWPNRFVMSDGTVLTAFIGVDRSPTSRLSRCVSEIAARIPKRASGGPDPEIAYAYLRDHIVDYLAKAPADHVYKWDPGQAAATPALMEVFRSTKDLGVGHFPARSTQQQPVVPLEKFIDAGYGTCLHQALLASLVLTELGLPHRLVNGATQAVGHTWIELPDHRILDPQIQVLAAAKPSTTLPGWIDYGHSAVFENQIWPYLAL